MDGEIDLILLSKYKDLIESIDALYTACKLMGKGFNQPLVSFYGLAVNGELGWNIFFEDIKIDLGFYHSKNDKMIITIREIVFSAKIEDIIEQYFDVISITNNTIHNKTVITVCLDKEVNQEYISCILKIIDIVLNY